MPINPKDYALFNGDEDNCPESPWDEDDYEDLEEDFEDCVTFEPIQKSQDPEGSLTDHRRSVEGNRNGAHKRNREAERRMKEINSRTKWGTDYQEE